MRRNAARFLVFTSISCLALVPTVVGFQQSESRVEAADAPPSHWTDLTDEPSRAALFAEHVMPKTAAGKPLDQSQSFSLKGPFSFPSNANNDGNKPRAPAVFGIDISHYSNRHLNFAVLKQERVDFVYMKTSQGVDGRDSSFPFFWKQAGLVPQNIRPRRGAYHFFSATGDPVVQAKSFVALLTQAGGLANADMPPVVDLEWDVRKGVPDAWAGQKPDEIIGKVLAWVAFVKKATGRTPMIYTARAWWHDRKIPDSDFAKFSGYYVWVADYSDSRRATEMPATPNDAAWNIWQFTDRALMAAGYPATLGVDANIFHGSEEEFRTAFHLPSA